MKRLVTKGSAVGRTDETVINIHNLYGICSFLTDSVMHVAAVPVNRPARCCVVGVAAGLVETPLQEQTERTQRQELHGNGR